MQCSNVKSLLKTCRLAAWISLRTFMDVSKSKTDAFESAIDPKVRKKNINKIIIIMIKRKKIL